MRGSKHNTNTRYTRLTASKHKKHLAKAQQKHTSKSPFLVDTNLGYLNLEGPGRQTVDTRRTSGLPLKTLGFKLAMFLVF